MKPLDGLRVLDLSRAYSGPYSTMMFGELGAEVIKVEEPGGDEARGWLPFVGEESAYFFAINRTKKSISLNLKDDRAHQIMQKLAGWADVVIENFTPGVADRLGVGYKSLAEINPRLIYCSISGYGQTGPYHHLKGYDPILQAMGGVMGLTGHPDGEPVKVGVPIGDLTASFFASIAILTALQARHRTGKGEYIDISLMDCQVSILTVAAAIWFSSGKNPARLGNEHPGRVPSATFQTNDGLWTHITANDRQWPAFCRVLGLERLVTDDFTRNRQRVARRDELMPQMRQAVMGFDRPALVAKLWAEGIPAGPVMSVEEVLTDPHVMAREMITRFNHPIVGEFPGLAFPFKFSESELSPATAPPVLGQHTEEILTALGYTADEQAQLRGEGVIA